MNGLFLRSLFVFLTLTCPFFAPALHADQPAAPWAQVATQTDLDKSREGILSASVRSAFEDDNSRRSLWVRFTDKQIFSNTDYLAAVEKLVATYEPRALNRRRARRSAPGSFDGYDLPVAPAYLNAVIATGAERRVVSRWLNAVSIRADLAQAEAIARMPFVQSLRLVRTGRRQPLVVSDNATTDGRRHRDTDFYGLAQLQLDQINLPTLHARGYTGDGIRIGVLDTGFRRDHLAFQHLDHPLTVVAEWDFVDGDSNTDIEPGDHPDQHFHGTAVLGTLAAYVPEELVGAAFDAEYVLAKVEDITSEFPLEEDWFAAGVEFLEAQGCDVATSSVVAYWYQQDAMDGVTSVMAQAFNIATANGMHCIQGVGNSGHDADPSTSSLVTPADALQVITCGSVDFDNNIASFSSDGPTVDGRVKPEVLARGQSAWTVSAYSTTEYTTESGASFATPQLAGAVACLVQSHPDWSVDTMRDRLTSTASYFLTHGTSDPLFVEGFGLVDVAAADVVPTAAAAFEESATYLDPRSHPNPFNSRTTISYQLSEASDVRLQVFDLQGRLLRTLVDQRQDGPALHSANWDGVDLYGRPVASGVYFYRLVVGESEAARRITLVK